MRFLLRNKRPLIWLVLGVLTLLGIKYFIPTVHFNFAIPSNVTNLISYEDFLASQTEDEFKIFPNDNCEPKRHVFFIKGHPSNPSNLQNLFFHYGDRNNLAIVLVDMEEYYAELKKKYSLKTSLPLNPNHHSDTLFSTRTSIPLLAAKQNYQKMKSILPPDTIFLTDLTDPVALTELLFKRTGYRGLYQNTSLSMELLEKFFVDTSSKSKDLDQMHNQPSYRFQRNPMSAKLGFDEPNFNDPDLIIKFIQKIDSRFHLVMIDDRMDEFLVHFYHLLCWPLDDLVIFRHSLRNNHLSHNLSSQIADKIRSYHNVDELLYKHFDEKLTQQTEAFGKTKMTNEITSLKQNIKLMYDKCLAKLSRNNTYNLSDILRHDFYTLRSKFEYNLDRKCYELMRWEAYLVMMPAERELLIMGSTTHSNRTSV